MYLGHSVGHPHQHAPSRIRLECALGALAECDHQTLKVTPAMAAGVTDKLWEIGDIVAMVEAWEAEQAKTGTVYKIGKDDIGDGYHVRLLPRYEDRCPSDAPQVVCANR